MSGRVRVVYFGIRKHAFHFYSLESTTRMSEEGAKALVAALKASSRARSGSSLNILPSSLS